MDLVGYRLANQQLTQPRFTRPADVVAWLGAVQAQDYAAAKWALGQRIEGCNDAQVEQAFSEGAILRTHVMRPTWHFVSPTDIRWMLALTAPRINSLSAYYYRQLNLDAKFFARSNKAIAKALQGGRELTRKELASVLQQAGILKRDGSAVDLRMANIMGRAELDCVVCSGRRRGNQFTYALFDERVPPTKKRSRSDALAELAIRYFTSHGPATPRDFAWWSGLTLKDAREGLKMVEPKLQPEVFDEQTYWMAPSISPERTRGRNAYLLPNYDEYIIGYADRSAISEPEPVKRASSRGNVVFNHTMVLDGKVAGTWSRSIEKARVTVQTKPFASMSAIHERKIAAAAKRYATFLGMELRLEDHSL